MSSPSLWYQQSEPAATGPTTSLLSELRRAGIHTRPRQTDDRGPGLVLFTRFTDALLETVRSSSRSGVDRVVAIHMAGDDAVRGSVWRLLQAGAADVLDGRDCGSAAAAVRARLARWTEVDRLMALPLVRHNLIGRSPVWVTLLREVVEAARFTSAPILLTGESGTGKELLARAIHSLDPRENRKDLVVLDCTTIVSELAGSEFFGHERGAYTGAMSTREGAFARADGGTLFLDEVGELPLRLQAQLLRVIQERTYKRVGGDAWRTTDFRLVAATNRNLPEMVATGQFRADLYHRMASISCRVPPLRARVDDIMALFEHFFEEMRPDVRTVELAPEVRQYLVQREYPGNVRDLRQLVARVAYRYAGVGPLTAGDLPQEERPPATDQPDWRNAAFETWVRQALAQGVGLRDIARSTAELAIRVAIDDAGGNVRQAAQQLGVTDRALHMRRAEDRNRQNGDGGAAPARNGGRRRRSPPS